MLRLGFVILFLFTQNTHCNIKNPGVIQRNHTAVGSRFEMNTDTLFSIVMLTTEIVTNGIGIDS